MLSLGSMVRVKTIVLVPHSPLRKTFKTLHFRELDIYREYEFYL